MLTQNEAMGAASASDGGRAHIASFWVRMMTSCISIKRGVWPATLLIQINLKKIYDGTFTKTLNNENLIIESLNNATCQWRLIWSNIERNYEDIINGNRKYCAFYASVLAKQNGVWWHQNSLGKV